MDTTSIKQISRWSEPPDRNMKLPPIDAELKKVDRVGQVIFVKQSEGEEFETFKLLNPIHLVALNIELISVIHLRRER